MRTLGWDPSLTRTAYALVETPQVLHDHGSITPGKNWPMLQRLRYLRSEILAVLKELPADVIAIETPSGRANNKGRGVNLAKYGMAVGVCIAAVEEVRDERTQVLCLVTDVEWSRTWRGTSGGSLTKSKRAIMLRSAFPGLPSRADDPGDDVADACGIAWSVSQRLSGVRL